MGIVWLSALLIQSRHVLGFTEWKQSAFGILFQYDTGIMLYVFCVYVQIHFLLNEQKAVYRDRCGLIVVKAYQMWSVVCHCLLSYISDSSANWTLSSLSPVLLPVGYFFRRLAFFNKKCEYVYQRMVVFIHQLDRSDEWFGSCVVF